MECLSLSVKTSLNTSKLCMLSEFSLPTQYWTFLTTYTIFSFLRASDVYMMLIAECGRHKEAETVRNMHYQGK